ncbi:MAG: hypothetical protein EB089_08135 [Acidimicrobiia bacterium]|nr:hypothetical protein [Acidimicrobiia bacterium]
MLPDLTHVYFLPAIMYCFPKVAQRVPESGNFSAKTGTAMGSEEKIANPKKTRLIFIFCNCLIRLG